MNSRILTHSVILSVFTALATAFRKTKRPSRRTVERPMKKVRRRTATNAAVSFGMLCLVLTSTAGAQSYHLQTEFGSFGGGLGQFNAPYGVAIDPSTHNIVVGDRGSNRLQIFDATGAYLSQFGTLGAGNGQFNAPGGLAIDPTTHNIVVADINNNRVQIFDSTGAFLRQFGSPGSGNGEFTLVRGIAIDPASHNIIVTDANRVEIFDSAGSYLSQFGSLGAGNGQFKGPIGAAVDPTSHNIFVADSGNSRVQVFDSTGAYLSQISTFSTIRGESGPLFVTIDPTSHNIIVADSGNDSVEIFDSTGVYLGGFSMPVGFDYPADEPEGVAIDPTTHNIVVVDSSDTNVDIFALPTAPPVLDLDQHGLTGSWYEPATSGQGLEVEVYPDLWAPGTGLAQVTWFTFDTAAGSADHQRWYSLSGPVILGQSDAELTIYQNTGGNFNALPITMAQAVGTATLSFATCTSGRLAYNFTDGTGRMGAIPLTRLTQNVTCSITTPFPTNADFDLSGNWFDSAMAGQGFTVEVNPISGVLFAAWYSYAPMGTAAGAAGQRWYTAQATFTAGMRSIPVTIYATTGGIFNTPTPGGQQTEAVGTGTLAFQSCAAATLSYNFTGGTSIGLSGTITLSRVGAVPLGCRS
jgi:DNA-binding beta-propeller fold protein YncE